MNKYEILSVVGEGAYGIVLKCRNRDTGEIVAVKKFKENDDDEIVRKTTLREVKTLRSLQHSNIVTLKEAFRRKGKLFLVFEYVEKNLLEVLEENPDGLELEEVRFYIYELMKAASYCHKQNIVHRDIKPENLLVSQKKTSHGRLKLCDFGFARQLPGKVEGFMTDYVSTRWYRSPELLLGSSSYGPEVDIWAIGCIMAELLDGKPLFPGDSDIDQLYIIQKLLGPLTVEQAKMFFKNGRFVGFKFPDMSNHLSLDMKYSRKLDIETIEFLKGLLQMDPKKRFSAVECLQHPYLASLENSARLRPESCLRLPHSTTTPLRVSQSRQMARGRHGVAVEESKKRDPPPSDDDSTLSISTRVTIELETSKAAKPMERAQRHKRPHLGKGYVGASTSTVLKERARLLPPSREENSRIFEQRSLNGLKQIGHEKPLQKRKDQSITTILSKANHRDSGLILQTPSLSYHAPSNKRKESSENISHEVINRGNAMIALNSENSGSNSHRFGVPKQFGKDRRLATRHGFPIPPNATVCEIHQKTLPTTVELERWKRQTRHSISSQGRIPVAYPLPTPIAQCETRKLHPIIYE